MRNPDYEAPKKSRRKQTEEALWAIDENITDIEYSDIMKKSYIDYSMSVITSRALPDVRDGLKPVQRRIVYDMSVLGTTSDKPYRKSARIVGDTMGKFHPHGDSSIYGALVNMAQDFRNNAPLVDGHGNFGSIEGDGAAAMRYTESRMTEYTEEVFLADLKENTVDFMPNYDESETEPMVLPCRLPNLLVNGSEGIAVGMATNIPMHNVGEVLDAAIYYVDHEKATTKDLMQFIAGPDFPTGGIVANKTELENIYESGIGKIRIRGKVEIEKEGGKDRIVISEIPYTMIGDGIGKFLQQVAALAETRVINDIVDISNQSSKDGIRIVIDLKKGADTNRIVNILYKKTKLEDTFGMNMLAIAKSKPETLSLARVYQEFTEFQYELNRRKYENLLKKAEKKKEIDEGLLKAIDVIDTVIEILRGSKTVKQAKDCFMFGKTDGINFRTNMAAKQAKKFAFTELQATSIMELRLQRLVGLELAVIQEDYNKVTKNISRYEKILASKTEMKKVIKADLVALKEKYQTPRKTAITDKDVVVVEEEPEQVLPVTIVMDRFFYTKAMDRALYEKNAEAINEEARLTIAATTDQKLVLFTDQGKAHSIKVKDIPAGKMKDKGVPIENISGYDGKNENIIAACTPSEQELIFVSSDGYVKRVKATEFDVTRKTVDASKLLGGAKLVAVLPYTNETLQLTSEKGFKLRFQQEEIPVQGKVARGAIGMKLADDDQIVDVTTESRMHIRKRGGAGKKG